MKRRRFLKTVSAAVGGLLSACNADDASDGTHDEPLLDGSAHFPQSLASGDPKPHSVVLWTRAVSEDDSGPLDLELQVALDAGFEQRVSLESLPQLALRASAAHDYCVRVRLDELDADTVYYYRFVLQTKGGRVATRVGRTKTAPPNDADANVTFAVMSCQDYVGRYYHAQRLASELALDFFVFLGDYIYETTDDAAFQQSSGDRTIAFDDAAGALEVPSDDGSTRLAASSLDNYRQLYRTYRADKDLQALHEQHAMVAVWDDHEFSNDAYGDTATYTNGRLDEKDPERRANADQAWFEYMPIDYPAGPTFEYDRDAEFPDNLRLYRDFEFGRHVHLFMTDLRRYRSGHILTGAELPGAIALTAERLLALEAEPSFAEPYVDVDAVAQGQYGAHLRQAIDEQRDPPFASTRLAGLLTLSFINQLIKEFGVALPALDDDGSLPLGVAYSALGKTEAYSAIGAHYFVGEEAFELVARARYEDTGGASEQLLGETQERWFIDALSSSSKTWKLWGNEYTLMRRIADLRGLPVPDALARRLTVSADDWDGAPNRRLELLQQLESVSNVVVLTGDLHSFFAGNLGVSAGSSVVEFVTGALSSATYASLLNVSDLAGELLGDGAAQASAAGLILQRSNPHMAYQNLTSNGFGVVHASASTLRLQLYQLPSAQVHEPSLDGELAAHFAMAEFEVESETGTLYRGSADMRRAWDSTLGAWTSA